MAKMTTVQAARASQKVRKCNRCRIEIQVGESYRYVDKKVGRSGYRLIWCAAHYPKPSDLASGRTAELMAIVEDASEGITTAGNQGEPRDRLESLRDALGDASSDIEGMADEIGGGADNIEEGFGHSTAQSEAMSEARDNLQSWQQTIDDIHDEIETALNESTVQDYTEEQDDEEQDDITEEQVDDFFSRAETAIAEEPAIDLQG